MSEPVDPLLEKVAELSQDVGALKARTELREGRERLSPAEAAESVGLPRDYATVEENVWRRFSPFRSRWPEVDAFDERVAELELRQAQISAERQQLHDRELAAPAADAEALAAWQLDGEKGPRPQPTLPQVKEQVERRQADHEALTVAIGRILDEKTQFVDRHRSRLVRDADKQTEQAHGRYLEAIEELLAAREELSGLRRSAVWARLFPHQTAMIDPPSGLVGGHPSTHKRFGLNRVYQVNEVAELLRLDASWLREAQTVEQHAATEGYDPRHKPGTVWTDDPAERAKRHKAMAEWVTRK